MEAVARPEAGTDEPSMTVSPTAAVKAAALLEQNGNPEAAIRVFVKSGGCSGYQYGMAVDDRQVEGDRVFESEGVRVVVDPRSWPLLMGSQVDFVENLMGGGFQVNNPNATSSCGCGHSFRTDSNSAPDAEGATGCGS